MDTNRQERINSAYNYLVYKGIVRNRTHLAKMMNSTQSNVSNAMNGNDRYLTDSFMKRFNNATGNLFNDVWLMNGLGEMLRPEATTTIGSQTQLGIVNNITNSHAGAAPSPLPQAGTNTEMPMSNQNQDAVLLDVISRQTDVISSLTRELANVRMQLEQQSAKLREMESALGCLAAHARNAHSEGTASEDTEHYRDDEQRKSVG